jgi:hypothetical protein
MRGLATLAQWSAVTREFGRAAVRYELDMAPSTLFALALMAYSVHEHQEGHAGRIGSPSCSGAGPPTRCDQAVSSSACRPPGAIEPGRQRHGYSLNHLRV